MSTSIRKKKSVSQKLKKKVYDCLVIGGGSGGLAFAKRAASYNASVIVIEKSDRLGGTCVNTGCVPKKILYNTAHVAQTIKEANEFAFPNALPNQTQVDWKAIKTYRDTYISRINNSAKESLDKLNIKYIFGTARIVGEQTVQVICNNGETKTIYAKHIVIATGGIPKPLGIPGDEWMTNSDEFFSLEKQPKKVAIIGGGYIAVEIAGVLHGLGSDTNIFIRSQRILRSFDDMLATHLDESMQKSGIRFFKDVIIEKITKETNKTYTIHLSDKTKHTGFDNIIEATGRYSYPYTSKLGLENVKVTFQKDGIIPVDKYQNTNVPRIYALGDVCGRIDLAPTAIAAGRQLAERLFHNQPNAHISYENVPTVVFSHPPIGTVGLTETQAIEKYGQNNITIFNSSFTNLWYATFLQGNKGDKPLSKYKVICTGKEKRVVGIHLIGISSDEIIQGFAVAMNMGAKKSDLDACIAVHPTAAEELVTLKEPTSSFHRR